MITTRNTTNHISPKSSRIGTFVQTTNVAKMVSEAWKTLPRPEREYWEEIARKDKERYEIEKSLYRGPWKVPVEKPSKDPSAPKRPMSAFLSFSNSKRSEMKRQYPSKNNAEISRMLAKLWKDASDDEKKAFMEHEVQQREAYKEALTEWKSNAQQRHDHKMQEQKGDLDQQITSDFLSRQEDSTSRPSPALYHAFSENMRSSSEKNLTPYGAITPQFPLPGGGPNPFFVPSDPNTFIPYFGLPSQQMALNFPNFNPLPMGESCTVNDPSFGLMSHLPTDGMDDEMTSAMNSFNSDSLQHSNRSSLLNNGGGGYDFRDDFVDLFD